MRKLGSKTRKGMVFATGLILPFVVIVASGSGKGSLDQHRPDPRIAMNGPVLGSGDFETMPLSEGYRADQEEIEELVSYEIPTAHHSLASPEKEVFWVTTGQPGGAENVAVTYDSGVVAIFGEQQVEDPLKTFTAIAFDHKNMTVETVQGVPALVIPPRSDMRKGNRGSVQFHLDGVSVTVYGPHDLAIEDLKEIASTFN